jgi:hypothetical protein
MKKASLLISSQTESKDASARGVEQGRYWLHQAYYLYPLAWDPFVLTRLDGLPILRERAEPVEACENSILVFTHPNTADDRSVIEAVLGNGGNVVLNHPEPEIAQLVAQEGFCSDGYGEAMVSLRERWHFSVLNTRHYIYPHTQPFLRLNPQSGRVLSHIGENPDLILGKAAAIFAGDPIRAVDTYQFTPHLLTGLMGHLAELLVHAVAHFTDIPMPADEQKKLRQRFELRRDFHSFGYAHWMVGELDRCYGGGKVDLQEAETLVMAAAEKAVRSGVRDATDMLRKAFESLERENRKIQPVKAVFADVLHGGELFDDIGYFEIDWPEHPADVLRVYLEWIRTRSYRVNVDLGATTVRELAKRFPDLFAELKKEHDRGRIEFVNGSANQPYPPFHSLESQIRQFDTGRKVWKQVFDTNPKTYASQEFGFCPQIGSVLKQQGYDNAVIRVQNMGDAPTLRDEQVIWEAPNGDKLRSLGSHPHKSESQDGNDYTYHNLHLKLYIHARDELPFSVFTCLGDITFHRWMREELARVSHYAPVFGEFETFSHYFRRTKKGDAPTRRFEMQDFNCDAAFINLGIWLMYKNYTGKYNTNCVRSMQATHLFAAAELIDAAAAVSGHGSYKASDHDKNWEALTMHQGHDTYIVPYHQAGGFQGPGDNPGNHEAGRGVQEVAEYLGAIDFRQVSQVTDKLMDQARTRADSCISHGQIECNSPDGNAPGFSLYNFAQVRQKLVRIPEAAGRSFSYGDEALPGQDDGPDRLVRVTLPAYGFAALRETSSAESSAPDNGVVAMEDSLENEFLKVEFDLQTGMIRTLFDKTGKRDLLAAGNHAFYFPNSARQVCRGSKVKLAGPLRGAISFELEFSDGAGNFCRLETEISLDAGQSQATIATMVHNVPEVEGNQWENHLGVRFELPEPDTDIHTSHFNVLEPFAHAQIFSPNVLVAQRAAGATAFFNEGNQFYVREGQALRHIMIMENEPLREFRYAIGVAGDNPIMESLKWSQPCYVQRTDRCGTGTTGQSLIETSSDHVSLLSCRYEEGALLVRLANTMGKPVKTSLKAFRPIRSAEVTGLDGNRGKLVKVTDGGIKLNLRPWDIRQLRITL